MVCSLREPGRDLFQDTAAVLISSSSSPSTTPWGPSVVAPNLSISTERSHCFTSGSSRSLAKVHSGRSVPES
jgi:hypothetical protein